MGRPHLRAVAFGLVVVAAFTIVRLAWANAEGFGPTDLARYEERAYGVDLPDWYGNHPFLLTWSRGDGQAFVTLASDPLAKDAAKSLDPALYRYHRVGFSILGRLLALGRESLIPLGLLAANALAVFTLAYLSWHLSESWGHRSLLLVVNPAMVIGFVTDTAEVAGLLALTLAVATGSASRRGSAAALAIIRPTYAIGLTAARRSVVPIAIALIAGMALDVFARFALGLEGLSIPGNLAFPFVGYTDALSSQTAAGAFIALSVAAAGLVTLVQGVRERNIAFVATGALVLLMGPAVTLRPANLLRAVGFLPVVWLFAGHSDERI